MGMPLPPPSPPRAPARGGVTKPRPRLARLAARRASILRRIHAAEAAARRDGLRRRWLLGEADASGEEAGDGEGDGELGEADRDWEPIEAELAGFAEQEEQAGADEGVLGHSESEGEVVGRVFPADFDDDSDDDGLLAAGRELSARINANANANNAGEASGSANADGDVGNGSGGGGGDGSGGGGGSGSGSGSGNGDGNGSANGNANVNTNTNGSVRDETALHVALRTRAELVGAEAPPRTNARVDMGLPSRHPARSQAAARSGDDEDGSEERQVRGRGASQSLAVIRREIRRYESGLTGSPPSRRGRPAAMERRVASDVRARVAEVRARLALPRVLRAERPTLPRGTRGRGRSEAQERTDFEAAVRDATAEVGRLIDTVRPSVDRLGAARALSPSAGAAARALAHAPEALSAGTGAAQEVARAVGGDSRQGEGALVSGAPGSVEPGPGEDAAGEGEAGAGEPEVGAEVRGRLNVEGGQEPSRMRGVVRIRMGRTPDRNPIARAAESSLARLEDVRRIPMTAGADGEQSPSRREREGAAILSRDRGGGRGVDNDGRRAVSLARRAHDALESTLGAIYVATQAAQTPGGAERERARVGALEQRTADALALYEEVDASTSGHEEGEDECSPSRLLGMCCSLEAALSSHVQSLASLPNDEGESGAG